MMGDIVDRLRVAAKDYALLSIGKLFKDAADEIETLRAEVQNLEEGEDVHAGAWVHEDDKG